MKKNILFLSIIILSSFFFFSFKANKKESELNIHWMTMQQAIDASKKKPKKIVVDIFTDWCGWCKKMDKDTYENTEIINYINQNYYAVKFNAERESDILFKDKVYKMPNSGGRATHEFTSLLMQGGGGYPTTCFFDKELNVLQSIPGYIDVKMMNMILKYFGGDHYKNTQWDQFQSSFK